MTARAVWRGWQSDDAKIVRPEKESATAEKIDMIMNSRYDART